MKLVILGIAFGALTGCSAAPKVTAEKPQYCYTNQTIVSENGKSVNSRTTVECSDDQIKRLTVARVGIGSNCGYFNGWMKKGGSDVQYRALSCQLPDGSWEIVDTLGQ
jgi:type IV pilus biogenesis protein CpaD/CtpE